MKTFLNIQNFLSLSQVETHLILIDEKIESKELVSLMNQGRMTSDLIINAKESAMK